MPDDTSSVKSVIDRIGNPDETITSRQLNMLSRLSDPDAALFQSVFLQSPASRRLQIISQMKQLSEIDLVPDFSRLFLICMTDPDQFVRAQAALGLGLEGEESLVTPLINMMLSDSSEVARAAAAKSLGAFATLGEFEELSADSTDKIYSALESIILNPSESVDVRNKALVAISVLSKPKIPGLIEDAYYSGDIMSKVSAIYAMGSTCNHRWLDILLSEFSNENTEVRLASVTACGEIGAEDSVPFLIDMVEDPEPVVQEAAVRALGKIGGDEAKEMLDALVESPRKRIRTAAQAALEEIKFCDDPLSWTP